VCVDVLLESARIYNFKGTSRDNRRFRSTIEMPKCFVFYTLALLGVRFFEQLTCVGLADFFPRARIDLNASKYVFIRSYKSSMHVMTRNRLHKHTSPIA
jgi:hypothetical protein